jgi:hypothetical protein
VPGLLKVQHGFGCAQALGAATEHSVGFRVKEMAVLPPGYNTGTVFLNGWRLAYRNEDHHVRGLGGAIYNITQIQNGDQNELHWEAGGVLADDDGPGNSDDPYEWCGIYTLVFWHRLMFDWQNIPPQIAALPYHTDTPPEALTFVHPEGSDPGNNTARRELPGFFADYDRSLPTNAVLPRAFGFVWAGANDHHLLQAGFDLGTPVPNADPLSWTSTTLWKDNSDRDAYHASAIVSVLSGSSVNMWHPDTVLRRGSNTSAWNLVANTVPLTPNNDPITFPDNCVGGDPKTQQVQFKIENVPFIYAVPVLTGWQLEYPCSDHHVGTIGVWIAGFSYDRAPGAATGTLYYTIRSRLADEAILGAHGGEAKYKISVLGLNPTALPPKQTVKNGPALRLPNTGFPAEPPPDDPPPRDPPPICQTRPNLPVCEDF